MFRCFCHKESRSSAAGHVEPSSPAAVPAPAKASGYSAIRPLPRPQTPPTTALFSDLRGQASNSQSRPIYPIPKVPGFEGLVDNEIDSDDELPHLVSPVTVSPPDTPGSARSLSGSIKTTASSPLSMLRAHVETLRRLPFSESTRCCAVNAASDTEDYAVAARRAEVRRLAHKMIQEELQKEQLAQSPHSFRRSAMTTIKEDPSDAASPGEGPSRKVGGSRKADVRSLVDGTPPAETQGRSKPCVSGIQSDYVTPKTANATCSFPLKRPPERIRLPRGLRIRNRICGAVSEKRWGKATLVTAEPQQAPEVATLEQLENRGKQAHVGGENYSENTPLGISQHISDQPKFASYVEAAANSHQNVPSGSLGSLDDEWSVHEAREAHVVAFNKPNSPILRSVLKSSDVLDKSKAGQINLPSSERPECTTHRREKSATTVASRISSLNLPAPLVSPDTTEEDHEMHMPTPIPDADLGSSTKSPPSGNKSGVGKFVSRTVPSRKCVRGFPFHSLSRLSIMKGLKEMESDTTKTSKSSSRDIQGRLFPELWWDTTFDACVRTEQQTDTHQTTVDSQISAPAFSKTGNEQEEILNPHPRLLPHGIEKVFKIGFNKLISLGQSPIPAQPATDAVPSDPDSRQIPEEPSLPVAAADKESTHLTQGDKIASNETILGTPSRPSSEMYTASSHNPSQDMIGEIDSIFGILINVDSNREGNSQQSKDTKKTDGNEDTKSGFTGKLKLPLTAPSTPVSKAYAEVQAYIITAFPENAATNAARQATTSSGISDYSDAVSQHYSLEPSPILGPRKVNEDGVSAKSASVRLEKKPEIQLTTLKYKTWSGPTNTQPGLMRSTLEFRLELERILCGEGESPELRTARALHPVIKHI